MRVICMASFYLIGGTVSIKDCMDAAFCNEIAHVAELADALDSGSSE
jgi:hypothetical protein